MVGFVRATDLHYDTSGRIRKGPAPTNMEIPKYAFIDDNTIRIGVNLNERTYLYS